MWSIYANIEQDKVLRKGAKLRILQFKDDGRAFVSGISKGGRIIRKWITRKYVTNYRVQWCEIDDYGSFDSQAEAQKYLEKVL